MFDHLTDDDLLLAAYASGERNPLLLELAKRLEQAHERAELGSNP